MFPESYREAGLNFTRVHSGVPPSRIASNGMSMLSAYVPSVRASQGLNVKGVCAMVPITIPVPGLLKAASQR